MSLENSPKSGYKSLKCLLDAFQTSLAKMSSKRLLDVLCLDFVSSREQRQKCVSSNI